MGAMASQITRLTIVYSTVYSGADQIKHQSSAWLAFLQGIHRWPANSPHKWPVTRKLFPFDDVIMVSKTLGGVQLWSNLIRYAHNGPFNEPAYFDILGLIFQIRAIKFGTNISLNMILNISSGYYHYCNLFCDVLSVFQPRALKITLSALVSEIFLRLFSNVAKIFIVLRSQTSSILEVLSHWICA